MWPFVIRYVRKISNHNIERPDEWMFHVMDLQRDAIANTMGVRIFAGQKQAFIIHVDGNPYRTGKRLKQGHNHSATANPKLQDLDGNI